MRVSSVQSKRPDSMGTGRLRTKGPRRNSSGAPKASPRASPRKAAVVRLAKGMRLSIHCWARANPRDWTPRDPGASV